MRNFFTLALQRSLRPSSRVGCIGLALLVAACRPEAPAFPPTPTTVVQIAPIELVANTREIAALQTGEPITTPAALTTDVADPTQTAELPACNAPVQADVTTSATHVVSAGVDYAQHLVTVAQRITFVNRTNDALAELVLAVEPNRLPNAFSLSSVQVDGQDATVELAGRRLTVPLVSPLQPGCALEIALNFRLFVPLVGQGINGNYGYFGYTERQFNLGHWLPTMAARVGGEWVTHDAVGIGEQIVADEANWYVTLNLMNAPEGMTVAAPGTVEQVGNQVSITLENTREIALSMSDQFNRTAQQSANGTMVELYTFSDTLVTDASGGLVDGAAQALNDAAQSLGLYSDLFGAYPQERYVVVEGDFTDGMEFTGIVFVSDDWFRTYPGSAAGYLTIITVHETAHQWWYARVGNDQALTPWLDESLATYSEYIYLEEFYPDLREWWWDFRVRAFLQTPYAGNSVNSTVYMFQSPREYINAVYLRGALMLDALRRDLGTEAFFAWVRRYADSGAGRIMAGEQFWRLLSPEERELTRATRELYLSAEAAVIP